MLVHVQSVIIEPLKGGQGSLWFLGPHFAGLAQHVKTGLPFVQPLAPPGSFLQARNSKPVQVSCLSGLTSFLGSVFSFLTLEIGPE